MRALHDSRSAEYRAPYGALTLGNAVELALDVWDAPGSSAVLRTWVEGVGEARYPMTVAERANGDGARLRFQATLEPEAAGAVWYQFVITHPDGQETRYGAQDGRLGGAGRLCDWEPPSFKLSVYDAKSLGSEALDREANRRFREALAAYLRGEASAPAFAEALDELRENYPAQAFGRALDASGAADCGPIAQIAASLREALPLFRHGEPSWFAANESVLGFWRHGNGESACILVNASPFDEHDVLVPMRGASASELVAGHDVPIVPAPEIGQRPPYAPAEERYARVRLPRQGSAVLYFHEEELLGKRLDGGMGVLAHITSLPASGPSRGEKRAGTLGAQARAFVDQLAEAGVRYWQVLPVNPTDAFGSPYAGISAFAGNPLLIDAEDVSAIAAREPRDTAAYQSFREREASWLEPYAAFMTLRQKLGPEKPWQTWPREYRAYDPATIHADDGLAASAEGWRRIQFAFDEQWRALRSYANERGVQIIGDMPIYVSGDSADTWANPGIFQLNENGEPDAVAGCPPDAFAAEGQKWGNPLYDWDALREGGYDWWLRRIGRALDLYDVVRLDHFIGFERYYAIPAGEKATEGSYRPGPGLGFFEAAREAFGPLPIIAEDLGLITPGVRALIAACGFPGMDVVQFVDGGDPLAGYQPRPNKIAYTGTHDNQTLVGYAAARYPGLDAAEASAEIMRKALASNARICIVPLQDVLGLGDEARMNTPGTAEGNWRWQADAANLEGLAARLRQLSALRP